MCAKQVKKAEKEVQTTGHSWDGIEEYDNPMPRWWVWVFYACIVWGIGYSIAYPAWPLIHGATQGLLGPTLRTEVVAEIARFDEANAPIKAKLNAALKAALKDPDFIKKQEERNLTKKEEKQQLHQKKEEPKKSFIKLWNG